MSSGPLHVLQIDLTAFRGIEHTLGLEFGRRLTIIYGGNATGKSSIAQAIEFSLSGQVRDHEDQLIPGRYLSNARATGPGRVSLTLDDGTVLTGATDRPHGEIERRFRDVGTVDWPERNPLPITTTHITTQGMLARVLGTANAVTRHDLSGLCAGAYLRFLVSRAQKLADYFRQASSGRNMQTELRDARAIYDTAKLLHDSLLTSSQTTEVSSVAIDSKLRELNIKLKLPEPTPVLAALSHLGAEIEKIENQLQLLQSLLARTRELGQHEAELDELKRQGDEARSSEADLQKRKAGADALLGKTVEQLKNFESQRTGLLEILAAHERHQQATSSIVALEDRLRDVALTDQRANEELQVLRHDLDHARSGLLAHSTRIAQLRQSRQTAEVQRNVLEQALIGLADLLTATDPELEGYLDVLRRELSDLERLTETASGELKDAREKEALIGAQLSDVSRTGERFVAAATEMFSFVTDGHCPLCGHDHNSREVLEQSIERVSAAMLVGTDVLRRLYQAASKARQDLETRQLQLAARIAETRAKVAELVDAIENRAEQRRSVISGIERSLTTAGLALPLETEVLTRNRSEVEARIGGLDQEIRDAAQSEREDEAQRSQLERALAAKSAEGEQLQRLAAELRDQILKVRATLGSGITVAEIAKNKADLAAIEPLVKTLQREQGQTQANLSDLDRALAERRAEIAGIQRRSQVVEAFLNSLDAELKSAGASRDVLMLVDMEQRSRQKREELVLLRTLALEIEQEQRIIEESRAISKAAEELYSAEQALKSLQNRHRLLQERSTQFKNLREALEELQNDTAEIVLEKIRKPVGIVFQAMTAGCPWEIEFKLEDGKVCPVLTDGSARELAATSVLNSAYLNVAAISLRLALASQQQWTRLRTVVLDDPILEMDNLTQSALIDGLEAVLASPFAPWADLQFVLTTWSEDFAVMAAHKLAHLNDNNRETATAKARAFVDNFVIHRLSLDPDGTIVSQQHVPRWLKDASAA